MLSFISKLMKYIFSFFPIKIILFFVEQIYFMYCPKNGESDFVAGFMSVYSSAYSSLSSFIWESVTGYFYFSSVISKLIFLTSWENKLN